MTTIFQRVDTALGTLSPAIPYAVAPYKGDLPDKYIAYQLIDSRPEQHADDAETERSDLMQVTIWDKAGMPDDANVTAVMTTAGFVKSRVRQMPQDAQTHHYGLLIEYSFM